jgi:hypothetical protein|tara:strand:+ start:766 stop:1275 length:510 start_codon:yes stop_codon:yes gene_type:complete
VALVAHRRVPTHHWPEENLALRSAPFARANETILPVSVSVAGGTPAGQGLGLLEPAVVSDVHVVHDVPGVPVSVSAAVEPAPAAAAVDAQPAPQIVASRSWAFWERRVAIAIVTAASAAASASSSIPRLLRVRNRVVQIHTHGVVGHVSKIEGTTNARAGVGRLAEIRD